MAATSVVSALFDLWDSIPADAFGGTERPPLFLGEAAQVTSTGTQQRVPYGVLYDDGLVPEFDSSFGGTEGGEFRLELFALKLDHPTGVTVDGMARGVKYANRPPQDRAGFDWGTLSLSGCLYHVSLKRLKEQRAYAGFNYDGNRVHKVTLSYRVVVGLKAGAAPAAP